MANLATILLGNAPERLKEVRSGAVRCAVFSPPYWGLRTYNVEDQFGMEETPDEYIEHLVLLCREVRRVLSDDGTMWINIGDTYNTVVGRGRQESPTAPGGMADYKAKHGRTRRKPVAGIHHKDLLGIPWWLALALRTDGWHLRSENVWVKPNAMTESAQDRPSRAHEHIFQFTKQPRYYYDRVAVRQHSAAYERSLETGKRFKGEDTGQQLRSVWRISLKRLKEGHFAAYPPEIPELCIKASTSEAGACAACGKPWRRQVKSERMATRPGKDTKLDAAKKRGDYMAVGNRDPERHITRFTTLGWESGCNCGTQETRPDVVLDPFNGSGTTGKVALNLGRDFIGCELNPEYHAMAVRRTDDGSMFYSVGTELPLNLKREADDGEESAGDDGERGVSAGARGASEKVRRRGRGRRKEGGGGDTPERMGRPVCRGHLAPGVVAAGPDGVPDGTAAAEDGRPVQ